MKIKDIKIQVIKRDKKELPDMGTTVRKDKAGFMDIEVLGKKSSHLRRTNDEFPLVTIITDSGIEGYSFGTDGIRQAQYIADMKPLLLDEDPLYPEKIWQKLWLITGRAPRLPQTLLGTVDIAIWDIIGKAANLPLYKVLGAYRDSVPAYASLFPTGEQWAIQDYAIHALECKKRGFTAYKLHIFNPVEEHMAVCRAVREAVGKGMVLIYDPVGIYEPNTALKIGRELEKLGFHWFEEPIQDFHMESLVKLCHQLDIPIASMEVLPGNIYSRAQYISKGAIDIVRSDSLFNGGITSLKKTASLAEAFGMNCEIHYNPNSLANAANLHVMCSIKNSEYFEWAVPERIWSFGVKKNIVIDNNGYVHVPQEPGLGLEIDHDYIDKHTIATL